MSWAERLLKWIEPEDNPRNTIYGALAAGFVIAAVDPARETYVRVTTATLIAVATYWLAHGYAHWVDQRFRATTHMGGSIRSVGSALSHEWPLAEGAAIPFAALLIAWGAGAPLTAAVPAACGPQPRHSSYSRSQPDCADGYPRDNCSPTPLSDSRSAPHSSLSRCFCTEGEMVAGSVSPSHCSYRSSSQPRSAGRLRRATAPADGPCPRTSIRSARWCGSARTYGRARQA